MKVLLLGSKAEKLTPVLKKCNDSYIFFENKIKSSFIKQNNFDCCISFGYRYIIKQNIINLLFDNIFNIHISLLPWNRGADPNFWSFFNNTPKGVTLHYIDGGVDTGDIIAQKELFFDINKETLKTSYDKLILEGVKLFEDNWSEIRTNSNKRIKQIEDGSFHYSKDKNELKFSLNDYYLNIPLKKLLNYVKN